MNFSRPIKIYKFSKPISVNVRGHPTGKSLETN